MKLLSNGEEYSGWGVNLLTIEETETKMIKVLEKDGLIHEYCGEQCGHIEELKEYDGLFKVIAIGEGLDSWLIPIADETEGESINISSDVIDLTHKTAYAYRCEEFYQGDFQNIIDSWCIVGESELSKDSLYELAKKYQPEGYSRVSIRECRDDEFGNFKITFHKQMTESAMRAELKKMGFVLKRHKDVNGVNMYIILKADNNSVYAGENFTMTGADVDRFIHE
ncbi:MAG: hypothetical protein IJE43_03010 [Alphaproteobacteria bacterium]|nr:hypothetical protein [Alphaproteobacteria bacterium]MBQ6886265.1 hypothetical protein [Lachnospiraceae bacterium]